MLSHSQLGNTDTRVAGCHRNDNMCTCTTMSVNITKHLVLGNMHQIVGQVSGVGCDVKMHELNLATVEARAEVCHGLTSIYRHAFNFLPNKQQATLTHGEVCHGF